MKDYSVQRSIAARDRHIPGRKFLAGLIIRSFWIALAVVISSGPLFAQESEQPLVVDPKTATEEPEASLSEAGDLPKEIVSKQELEQQFDRRKERDFKRAILAGQRSTDADKAIREGVRAYVYRMALKENRKNVSERRDELMRQLRIAGTRENREQLQKTFRTFVCKEVLDRAKELLDNNTEVRLNATILISDLNVVEPGPRNNPPAQAYSPSSDVLLEIINDQTQPVSVKIVAGRGITRMALLGTPLLRSAHKNDLVNSIVKQLQIAKQLPQDQAGSWYQARLLEALAAIDLPLTVNGNPVIFTTLESFLEDEKREHFVRCMAAKSLGRAKLAQHPDVKSDRLALKLGKLGLDLTNGFNQRPQRYNYWQRCFWDLYVAFRPENDQDKIFYRNRKIGLLAKYPGQKDIKDAYDQIIPLTKHILQQPIFTPEGRPRLRLFQKPQIQALSDWVKNHPQAANYRLVTPEDSIRTAGDSR